MADNHLPKVAPSKVLAQLVTDFCLPVITGTVQSQPPSVPHRPLERSERVAFGFENEGQGFMYSVDATDVFMDLAGNRSLVWFVHDQAKGVQGEVERAILGQFPKLRLVKEGARAEMQGLMQRVFVGDLSDKRRAQVEIVYPGPSVQGASLFSVRVLAFQIGDPSAVGDQKLPNATTTTRH